MENISNETPLEQLARKRVLKLKGFYIHAFIYGIGLMVYVLKTYFGAPLNFSPLNYLNFTAMAIWTFFFVEQGLPLFFKETFFGKNWEKKRINEILEKEKETKNTWE